MYANIIPTLNKGERLILIITCSTISSLSSVEQRRTVKRRKGEDIYSLWLKFQTTN